MFRRSLTAVLILLLTLTPPSRAVARTTVPPLLGGPFRCGATLFIGVAGSGELNVPNSLHMGPAVKAVYDEVASSAHGDVVASALNYPADAVWPDLLVKPWKYAASVNTGISRLQQAVTDRRTQCGPGTKVLLGGYSQGAWVIGNSLTGMGVANSATIAGIALLGDPRYDHRSRAALGSQARDGVALLVPPVRPSYLIPGLVDRTRSWCLTDDPVCSGTKSPATRSCLTGVLSCPHFKYSTTGTSKRAGGFLSRMIDSPYGQLGVTPDRAGVNMTETTLTAATVRKLGRAWTYAGSPGDIAFGTPVVSAGTAFITASVRSSGATSQVRAISMVTGRKLWQTTLDGYFHPIPAVAGHLLIAQTSAGVFGLAQETGHVIWTNTDGANICGGTAPAVSEGVVYVPTADGLLALDAATGTARWSTSLGGCATAPALSGGRVFTSDNGAYPQGRIDALNATTGAVIWQRTVPQPIDGYLSAGGGMVFAATQYEPGLLAYNAADGQPRWQASGTGYMQTLTYTGDAILVAGGLRLGVQRSLSALRPATGATVWTTTVANSLSGKDVVVANSLAFVGSQAGYVNIFDVHVGKLLFQLRVPQGMESFNPVVADGGILAQTGTAPQLSLYQIAAP
jgi:outer membrane protein assembly factor BamB